MKVRGAIIACCLMVVVLCANDEGSDPPEETEDDPSVVMSDKSENDRIVNVHSHWKMSTIGHSNTKFLRDDLNKDILVMEEHQLNRLLNRVDEWKGANIKRLEPHEYRIYALKQLLDDVTRQWNGLAKKLDEFENIRSKDTKSFSDEEATNIVRAMTRYSNQIDREVDMLTMRIDEAHTDLTFRVNHPEVSKLTLRKRDNGGEFMRKSDTHGRVPFASANATCGGIFHVNANRWKRFSKLRIQWYLNALSDAPHLYDEITYEGVYFTGSKCNELVKSRTNLTRAVSENAHPFCEVCETPLKRLSSTTSDLSYPTSEKYVCATFLCRRGSVYVWNHWFPGNIMMGEFAVNYAPPKKVSTSSVSRISVVILGLVTLLFLSLSAFILVA